MTKHIGRRLAALVLPVLGAATLPAAAVEESLHGAEAAVQGADPLVTLGLVVVSTVMAVGALALTRRQTR